MYLQKREDWIWLFFFSSNKRTRDFGPSPLFNALEGVFEGIIIAIQFDLVLQNCIFSSWLLDWRCCQSVIGDGQDTRTHAHTQWGLVTLSRESPVDSQRDPVWRWHGVFTWPEAKWGVRGAHPAVRGWCNAFTEEFNPSVDQSRAVRLHLF